MLQIWFVANSLFGDIKFSVGGFGLGLNVVTLALVGAVWLGKKGGVSNFTAKVLLVLLGYMVFSYCIAATGLCEDKFLKSIITAPILLFLIFLGFEIGWKANNDDWLKLQKTVSLILLVAFLAFMVEMLLPDSFTSQARYRMEGKYSGLYSEPSHVAYSLFPCVVILLMAESKQFRRKGMLALFGLILFSRSSTLIGLTVAWLLYNLFTQGKFRKSALLILGMVSLFTLGSIANYDYFLGPIIARATGVLAGGDSENLSSLVYVQGWQDAWANLLRTNGLGLGFNMMGCTPLPVVPIRDILGADQVLNTEDGSFLFSKLVSEAGVIGILFTITIVRLWLKSEKAIHNELGRVKYSAIMVQSALIFSFIVTIFLRSASYFGGGILICVVAVAGAAKWHKESRVRALNGNGDKR